MLPLGNGSTLARLPGAPKIGRPEVSHAGKDERPV